MKRRVVAYWLIPAKAQRELFRDLIRILARQCKAPRFEPHVTILLTENKVSPSAVLRKMGTAPLRLRIRGIGTSARFTKTLFLRLHPSDALNHLSRELAGLTKSRRRPVRDPHLSLLYKKLPARTSRELATSIKLPFREIVFDSIKAVRCAYPTTTAAEVKQWKVMAARSLR